MNISDKKVAYLTYVLKDNNKEELIEQVGKDNPQAFLFGGGLILENFEQQLYGLTDGDKFDFVLKNEQAYGARDPHAVMDIPKDTFVADGKVDEEMLRLGNEIPMQDNDGNRHIGRIIGNHSDHVVMDFNHPLSGKDLHFSGQVVNVRDANEAELQMLEGCGSGHSCGCHSHDHHGHHAHEGENCRVCGNPPEKQGQGMGGCQCS